VVGDEETFPTTYHLPLPLTDKYQTFNQIVLRFAHFQSCCNSVLNQSALGVNGGRNNRATDGPENLADTIRALTSSKDTVLSQKTER
jgi:hypothetical protein